MAEPRRPERGTGLLGTAFGVAMVVALIGVAANVTVGLWTRSAVEAAAADAGRRLARTDAAARPAATAPVLERARAQLGPHGRRTTIDVVSLGPDVVALRVRAPGVGLLPRLLDGRLAVGGVDRVVTVRAERAGP